MITNTYRDSYEAMNLLARHNIPFPVLKPSDVKPHSLDNFDLLVTFATPDEPTAAAIADFATRGGIAVLVGVQGGQRPWQSTQPVPAAEHAVSYATGKGRVIELSEAVTDPETFAQDIRRLMNKDNVWFSLWNSLTTLAVSYRHPAAPKKSLKWSTMRKNRSACRFRSRDRFPQFATRLPSTAAVSLLCRCSAAHSPNLWYSRSGLRAASIWRRESRLPLKMLLTK